MGGTWGAFATGLFATVAVNSAGANGLFYGNPEQLLLQTAGIVAVWTFAFGATWILGKAVDRTIGLRVSPTEETVGLDISQHGERAYGGQLR
jgi:Amt family ammonium transporter